MPKLSLNTGPRLYTGGSGLKYPGVTTVLGILDNREWANAFILKNGRRELDRLQHDAAARGTAIHALANRLAWDRNATVEPGMEPYAAALLEFFDQNVQRVIATELSLVSEKERVGGTCDLVAVMRNGSRAVVDFKSKKNGGVTARDRAQTAGYALLLGEHGYRVTQRVIVRLHTSEEKRGRWYCRHAEDHWGDVRAFRSAVELWHWKNGAKLAKDAGGGPRNNRGVDVLMPKLNPPAALQRRRFGIIKESVRVETLARDLIEEATGNLRENGEYLRGYCPVCGNGNHSRAFQVSREKNLWNCFACGEGGDVIDLAQLAGGFQYASEAAAWLGWRYGVDLPRRPDSWFRKQSRQERLREQVAGKRCELKRRRLFKYLMLPVLEDVPEQDRDKETEIAWAEFRKLPIESRLPPGRYLG